VQREGRRALHCGRYKVHTPTIDFEVIYLDSEVTNDAIDEAFNKHFHPGKTHVERRPLDRTVTSGGVDLFVTRRRAQYLGEDSDALANIWFRRVRIAEQECGPPGRSGVVRRNRVDAEIARGGADP
jgi:hypothetical protein